MSLKWTLILVVLLSQSAWLQAQRVYFMGASAAPPPTRTVILVDSENNVVQPLVVSMASVVINVGVTKATELVPLTIGQVIYVTYFSTSLGGSTTYKFVTGTGTNCADGQSDLIGPPGFNGPKDAGTGVGWLFKTPVSQALCIVSTAASVDGVLSYAKF